MSASFMKRIPTSRARRPRVPTVIAAIAFALAIGAAIILATGANPIVVYVEILRGALLPQNLPITINWATPLLGMALAAAIPLRGGIINLGGDGQMLVGALIATCTALYLPVPFPLSPVVAVLLGAFAGAVYAGITAVAENRFGVPLLISSLLLSYIATGVTSYLVKFPLADVSAGLPQTREIPAIFTLPTVFGITSGAALILLALIVIAFYDKRFAGGYELRVRHENASFARYIGIRTSRQALLSMSASGGVAGVVGAILALGMQHRFIDGALTSPSYTWSGLMAALLARGEPVGTAIGAIFFAALQTGGFAMQRETGIPRVLTMIIQAVIILFLALRSTQSSSRA